MARIKNVLYVATHRFVAAVEPKTGEEVWRTKLPHGGSAVPTMVLKGDHIYIGHAGYVYCLDRRMGQVLWENDLPKMGFQSVVLAMEGATAAATGAVTAVQAAQQRAAAAASSGGAAGAV